MPANTNEKRCPCCTRRYRVYCAACAWMNDQDPFEGVRAFIDPATELKRIIDVAGVEQ